MAKTFLTDAFIKHLICPANKDQFIVWDHPCTLDGKIKTTAQQGLGVRVTVLGAKSFVHSYRVNGKRHRKVLGPVSRMSVGSARLMVQQREHQIEEGLYPDEEQINYRHKHSITLREVVDQYYEQRMHSRGKHHRSEFGRLIAPWTRPQPKNPHRGAQRKAQKAFALMYSDMPAQNMTPQHVNAYLKQIKNDHRYNGALRQIRTLFNWAIKMQLVDMRNPSSPFEVRKTYKHRRDYHPHEIKAIAAHIFNPALESIVTDQKEPSALVISSLRRRNDSMRELCNYMGILFLTMARPIEVKSSLVKHFDLDQLIWHKHNTKGIQLSKKVHEYAYRSVPIHEKVVEMIMDQRLRWPDSPFLFPNHTDNDRPRDNFHKAVKQFKELEGVPAHFQLYDLKRIAISLMLTGQGVAREAVSHYVDHKGNLETTMLYDLGFVDPLRPVTQKLGELLGV